MGCYGDSSEWPQAMTEYDYVCKNYKDPHTDNKTDNGTRKKGAATSDKTCSWRMLGLAVAGGLAAVM